MSFFDRIRDALGANPSSRPAADEQAIARYRYLLRTAPPEAIEQAHAEAFAQLTPQQRRRLLEELCAPMPQAERNAAWQAGEQPAPLARVATRAELREPGALERAWHRIDASNAPGVGPGGVFAGGLLGSMAGAVLGTMVAAHFLAGHPDPAAWSPGSAGADLADDPWQRAGSPADVAPPFGDAGLGDLPDSDIGTFDV